MIKKTTKVARAVSVAQSPRLAEMVNLEAMYNEVKDRVVDPRELDQIMASIRSQTAYSATKHDDKGSPLGELYVFREASDQFTDDNQFVIWYISDRFVNGSVEPSFRVTEINRFPSLSEAWMQAADWLMTADDLPLYFTHNEVAQLQREAIFEVEYDSNLLLINENTGGSGYTFTQLKIQDLQLVEQEKFFDLDEAKQCVRGQITSALDYKLERI